MWPFAAALPQDSFLCSWVLPLHCTVLLPVAHTAAGPDTAGPIRACPSGTLFPALLQIVCSWTLSSCLTNSVLHHFLKLSFLIEVTGTPGKHGCIHFYWSKNSSTWKNALRKGLSLWVLGAWGEFFCRGGYNPCLALSWATTTTVVHVMSNVPQDLHWMKSQFRAPLRVSSASVSQKQILPFLPVIWTNHLPFSPEEP